MLTWNQHACPPFSYQLNFCALYPYLPWVNEVMHIVLASNQLGTNFKSKAAQRFLLCALALCANSNWDGQFSWTELMDLA